MDLSQATTDDTPASTSGGDRSNEEASAVAQLLEMAQTYSTTETDLASNNVDKEPTEPETSNTTNNVEGGDEDGDGGGDGEGGGDGDEGGGDGNGEEQAEKDPYEMSGKEAEFKCHCKYFRGKPCYTRYERQELMAFRSQYKALNKKELDIAILSKIQTGMHLSPMTCQKKKLHTERKKVRSDHYFHGDKICRDTFCFIHRISHNKLSVLMAHYRGSGICVRIMKREAEKEAKIAEKKAAKLVAKRAKGKGKGGAQKARKRKPKGAVKQQGGLGASNKRQRVAIEAMNVAESKRQKALEQAINNESDPATAIARHIEAMHQYVDIPIGTQKRYMNVAATGRDTNQSTATQQHHMPTVTAGSVRHEAATAQSLQTVQGQHPHHGVWHLPRRPDMQHEGGPYLLPL